jgi:hypothetical protein
MSLALAIYDSIIYCRNCPESSIDYAVMTGQGIRIAKAEMKDPAIKTTSPAVHLAPPAP